MRRIAFTMIAVWNCSRILCRDILKAHSREIWKPNRFPKRARCTRFGDRSGIICESVALDEFWEMSRYQFDFCFCINECRVEIWEPNLKVCILKAAAACAFKLFNNNLNYFKNSHISHLSKILNIKKIVAKKFLIFFFLFFWGFWKSKISVAKIYFLLLLLKFEWMRTICVEDENVHVLRVPYDFFFVEHKFVAN